MRTPEGEPDAGPWRAVTLRDLLDLVLAASPARLDQHDPLDGPDRHDRPAIVAVDGRSASGKSTLAERLHALVPASAVVHTDDLAWHEPLFGWGHLLRDDVLVPLRQGRALDYRPPQWQARGRQDRIVVPAGLSLVLVEGVGASHREHEPLLDATVWVQSDHDEAERRGIARDVASGVNGDAAQAAAFWHAWMPAETAFLAEQRPWERAAVVVNGTAGLGAEDDLVEVSTRLRERS